MHAERLHTASASSSQPAGAETHERQIGYLILPEGRQKKATTAEKRHVVCNARRHTFHDEARLLDGRIWAVQPPEAARQVRVLGNWEESAFSKGWRGPVDGPVQRQPRTPSFGRKAPLRQPSAESVCASPMKRRRANISYGISPRWSCPYFMNKATATLRLSAGCSSGGATISLFAVRRGLPFLRIWRNAGMLTRPVRLPRRPVSPCCSRSATYW